MKRVPCEICGKILLGKQYVRSHQKIIHKELLNNPKEDYEIEIFN